MLKASRFHGIIKDRILRDEHIVLTFVLVCSRKYSTACYWKVFVTDRDVVVDVSGYIGVILDLDEHNNDLIRTSSWGVNIPDAICQALEKVFQDVYVRPVKFEHRYFDATLGG